MSQPYNPGADLPPRPEPLPSQAHQEPPDDPFARYKALPELTGDLLRDWDQIVAPGTPG